MQNAGSDYRNAGNPADSTVGGGSPGQHRGNGIGHDDKPLVGEILGDASNTVRQEASDILALAKERGKAIIDEQIACAASEVSQVAEVMQHAADELNQRESRFAAHYVERSASCLKSLSDSLEESDASALARSAEAYASKSPGIFLGISVAAGFLVGRFLISSAQRALAPQQSGSPAGTSTTQGTR